MWAFDDGRIPSGSGKPASPQDDLFDVRGFPDHGENDVAPGRYLSRGLAPGCALPTRIVGLVATSVENGNGMAALQDVQDHGTAHDAGSDPADSLHEKPPKCRPEMLHRFKDSGTIGQNSNMSRSLAGKTPFPPVVDRELPGIAPVQGTIVPDPSRFMHNGSIRGHDRKGNPFMEPSV